MDQDAGQDVVQYLHFQITSAVSFRAALARLRLLEGAKANTSAGRERDALELAVSRYLAKLESEKTPAER